MKKSTLIIATCLNSFMIFANGNNEIIRGKVTDNNGQPLIAATIFVEGTSLGTITNEKGEFELKDIPASTKKLSASYLGYESQSMMVRGTNGKAAPVHFILQSNTQHLSEVEVFGNRYKQQEKLDYISRMPLRPSEQIQSISVISDKLISQQGSLNLSDAAKNDPRKYIFPCRSRC